jgi:WD40 repeat protein
VLPVGDDGLVVGVSADGRLLAIGSPNQSLVQLWNVSDPSRPVALDGVRAPNGAGGLGFVNRALFAFPGDTAYEMAVWDIPRSGAPVPRGTLSGTAGAGVASSRGNDLLTFGPVSPSALLWNLASAGRPSLRATVPGPVSDALMLDDRTVLTVTKDGSVRVWDLTDPRHPRLRSQYAPPKQTFSKLALSNDGRVLLDFDPSGAGDVLDVANPDRLTLVTALRDVRGAEFSPDSRSLLDTTAGFDGHSASRLLDVDAGRTQADLCTIGVTELSQFQWRQYAPNLPYRSGCG